MTFNPEQPHKITRRNFLILPALLPTLGQNHSKREFKNFEQLITPRTAGPDGTEMGWHNTPGEWYYISAIHKTAPVGFIISAGKTPFGEGVLAVTYSDGTHTEKFYSGPIDATPKNTQLQTTHLEARYSLSGSPNNPYTLELKSPNLNVSSSAQVGPTFWHGEAGDGRVPTSSVVVSDPYYSQLLIPNEGSVIIGEKSYKFSDFYAQLDHQVLSLITKSNNQQRPILPVNHNWAFIYCPDGSVITGTTLRKEEKNTGVHSSYLMRLFPDGSIQTQPGVAITGTEFDTQSGFPRSTLIHAPALGVENLNLLPFSPSQTIAEGAMMEAFGAGSGQIDGNQITVRTIIEATQRQFNLSLPTITS